MSDKTRTFVGFIVVVIVLTVISYKYYFTGYDCVKVKIDGSVHCSCEFDNKDGWRNFKNLLGNDWEPVTFPSGYEPCKGFKGIDNENRNSQLQLDSHGNALATQDEPKNSNESDSRRFVVEQPKNNNDNRVVETSQVDTIPLLRDWKSNEKPGLYLSNKLPLSYAHKNLKFTFYKEDDLIKVKCFDDGELYNTFTCTLHDNIFDIENADGFFSFSGGKLTLVYPKEHSLMPLYMAKN
jgi:hypothetical protein